MPNRNGEQKESETEEARSEEQQEEEEEEKVLPGTRQGIHFSPCKWPFPKELPSWRAQAGAGERYEREKTSERNSYVCSVTPPGLPTQLTWWSLDVKLTLGKGGEVLFSSFIYRYIFFY